MVWIPYCLGSLNQPDIIFARLTRGIRPLCSNISAYKCSIISIKSSVSWYWFQTSANLACLISLSVSCCKYCWTLYTESISNWLNPLASSSSANTISLRCFLLNSSSICSCIINTSPFCVCKLGREVLESSSYLFDSCTGNT